MKSIKILVAVGMSISILLSACAPAALTPTNPPTQVPVIKDGALLGDVPYVTDPVATEKELADLSAASTAFALSLYQQLSSTEGNLFYSPYSIFQALLMTYAGANGMTAEQMAAVLSLPVTDPRVHTVMNALNASLFKQPAVEPGVQPLILTIANALWGQENFSFNQDFLNTLSSNYAAGLRLVDYNQPEEARKLINTWVAAQTNDKIRDLIPQGVLNEMTRLVLTNAVYFKGAWLSQFNPDATRLEPFYGANGAASEVSMMRQNLTAGAILNNNLAAIRLPYEGGDCSMIVLMPTNGTLAEFESSLTAQSITDIIGQLKNSHAKVDLGLPKFKYESSFSLSDVLKNLGMSDAFDPGLADFSGMTSADRLYIQDVLHKAFVDVNEEGTEAAAATAVVAGVTSMPAEVLQITFDHPFIFAIESAGTVLFMGRVVQP